MELTSSVLFFMLWIPVYTRSPTGSPSLSISCEECSQGFNRTHNWRCRFGCGDFYKGPRHPARRPASVTKPTPEPTVSGHTRRGSYVDCKDCFGHGKMKTPDPRCKYGCGRWMTWPTTPKTKVRPATFTDSPVTSADVVKNTEDPMDDHASPSILKATPVAPEAYKSFKTTYLRYRNSIVIIGLFVGLAAMLVGYALYTIRRRKKSNAQPNPIDVAVVMNDLYNY